MFITFSSLVDLNLVAIQFFSCQMRLASDANLVHFLKGLTQK